MLSPLIEAQVRRSSEGRTIGSIFFGSFCLPFDSAGLCAEIESLIYFHICYNSHKCAEIESLIYFHICYNIDLGKGFGYIKIST
jgi:hypothetical protein